MTTECLFRDDPYLTHCPATVMQITEQGGIVLNRTVAYANSGGQPGDIGTLSWGADNAVAISTAVYTDPAKTIIAHVPAPADSKLPSVGETVELKIDWGLRYRRMRMHTALHLLSAILPYPVTGGSVG